jgi:putative glutamine amidotransferase
MSISPRPFIGVTACLKERDESFFHSVQKKYVDAVIMGAAAVPMIVPAAGDVVAADAILDRLDGLMLTGSPSNVGPHLYGGPEPRADNLADPARDATTLPLIRRAVAREIPILAICRGIQELNVALGGSLHQHLHEVPGRDDHRSDKTRPRAERYEPRHPIRLTPDGLLQQLFETDEVIVNSLHGQGIERLAGTLTVEALAVDGTIEAVSVTGARTFMLGCQWHPEYSPVDDPWSRRLFQAFGEAAARYAASKVAHAGLQRVA